MKKLEEKELTQLKGLQNKSQDLIIELGQISFNEIVLEKRKENAKIILNKVQDEEKTLKEFLISKYGNIDINLETGEY